MRNEDFHWIYKKDGYVIASLDGEHEEFVKNGTGPIYLVVQSASGLGPKLLVDCVERPPRSTLVEHTPIRPAHVKEILLFALDNGWNSTDMHVLAEFQGDGVRIRTLD